MDTSRKDFLKGICRRFGQKDSQKQARLYSKQGIEIMHDDLPFLRDGDICYIALQGEDFNNCANLDDYEIGVKLGEGGFGEVILGKEKSGQKREVAIKFMDVSEYCKFSSTL